MSLTGRTLQKQIGIALSFLAFFALWLVLYDAVNTWASVPGRAREFVSALVYYPWLYQPWLAPLYILGGFISLAVPIFIALRNDRWRRILLSLAVASAIALIVYVVWPVSIARPVYGTTTWAGQLMTWYTAHDKPTNTFPSGHTYFAMLAALWIQASKVRRSWKTLSWALAVGLMVSTVMVGQHYPMDVLGGIVVGLISYWFATHVSQANAFKNT